MIILALAFILAMVLFFVLAIGGVGAIGVSTAKSAINMSMPVEQTIKMASHDEVKGWLDNGRKPRRSRAARDAALEQKLGRESHRGADVIFLHGPPDDIEVGI